MTPADVKFVMDYLRCAECPEPQRGALLTILAMLPDAPAGQAPPVALRDRLEFQMILRQLADWPRAHQQAG